MTRAGLSRVLINLISNAIKFTDHGQVTIQVKPGDECPDGTLVEFNIIDTGVGIPSEKARSIFDSFEQVDPSTSRKYGGSGLGLSISKQLVNLMGGTISAQSDPGQGSTFSFTIVNYEGTAVTAAQPRQQIRSTMRDSVQDLGFKILLAEDNAVNQMVARTILTNAGCEVVSVVNGKEAIEAVKTDTFDLVLMDCHMPDIDGFDAARQIRRLEDRKGNVPIVAITANALPEMRDFCLKCGMNDYLTKPFTPDELLNIVSKSIGNQDQGDITTLQEPKPDFQEQPEPKTNGHDAQKETITAKFGYDNEMAEKIINMFISDTAALLKDLLCFIETEEMEKIRITAHSLKGSAAFTGARNIQQVAYKLETAAKNSEKDQLFPIYEKLQLAYDNFKSDISSCN